MEELVMTLLDLFGTAVFALTGAVAGVRRKFDIFGVTVLGCCVGVGGGMLAMYMGTVQALSFKSAMTYEILLIVVIGGMGSVSGSVMASFLFIACSEWWLRFLDSEMMVGTFKVPLLAPGFRMVVFSVVIMVVVLFFRKGIMGDRELWEIGSRRGAKGGRKS